MFKVGVIGLGNIGSLQDENKKHEGVFSHLGAYKEHSDKFKVSAVLETDIERLNESIKYWKIENGFSDFNQFINFDTYDVISICTPDDTHYELLKKIIDVYDKLFIFLEKPAVINLSQALDLQKLLKMKPGIKIFVNYHRRKEKFHMQLAVDIKNKKYGELTAANCYYVKGTYHIGCSMINTIRFFFGEPVFGQSIRPYNLGTFKDFDPSMDFILFFENDRKVYFQGVDKTGYKYSIFEIDLLFEKQRVRLVDNGSVMEFYDVKEYHNYSGFKELVLKKRINTNIDFCFSDIISYIYDVLTGNIKHTVSTFEDAIKDIFIIERISNNKGKNIKL